MANTFNTAISDEYKYRINKVFDYIESHIGNNFTLEELANVATFSKFHFHRIFQALVGETPFQFILRTRLEKAATQLIYSPKTDITEIAHLCGFSDLSVFSRNFKNRFNLSPSEYRKRKNSNLSQIKGNSKQIENKTSMYFCSVTKSIQWRTTMKINEKIEVKELQDMTVAYLRYVGPYKGNENLFEELWGKMCGWAGARGLMQQKDLKFIVMYHDDPSVTDEKQLRMSVCLTVPKDTKVDGEIGKMHISGGKYLMARFKLNANEFQQAWEYVYGEWLPNSGFQPDDKPCFEMYPEAPENGKYLVDICVPVKPL